MRNLSFLVFTLCCTVFPTTKVLAYEPNIDFDFIISEIKGLWEPQPTHVHSPCAATVCKTEQDLVIFAAGILQEKYGVNAPIRSKVKAHVYVNKKTAIQATIDLERRQNCFYAFCWQTTNEQQWTVEYSTPEKPFLQKEKIFVNVIRARYRALKKAHDAARKVELDAAERRRELQRQRARGSNNFYYGNEYPDYSDRPFGLTINSIGELGWGAGFGSWSGSY